MALGPIRKLWRLSRADRSLLIHTVLLLGASRVALWILPLRVVRRLLARTARPAADVAATLEGITWAISVARRVVPRATCLPQALAAEALLARGGHPAALRIGVTKSARGRLVAHAWVESGGHLVVGELHEGLSGFTPLPPLPGARV